jgi:N-acetylmuramoyl-L-alanine amidase
MKTAFRLFLLLLIVAAACSPKHQVLVSKVNKNKIDSIVHIIGPYDSTNKVYEHQVDSFAGIIKLTQPSTLIDTAGTIIPSGWVGSVNFGIRRPNYVIIHFTAQDSVQQTLKTFTIKSTETSAHYVIAKDGTIYHMVNDYLRANQAGLGKWGSITDMNSCSIGIEIDNNGNEPYTDKEISSLLALLARLKTAYNIPQANFIGHQDWAPKRKPDPGPHFPWKVLAQHGFGYWSDEVLELAPENYDHITALRLIGYDTSDTTAAIVAFKRHFVQSDVSPQLTQLDLNILYNISKKYQDN